MLAHCIREEGWFQVLVFSRTKHGANKLAQQLSKEGIDADAFHGNKSQAQRTRALKDFKDSKTQVLVATDIAAITTSRTTTRNLHHFRYLPKASILTSAAVNRLQLQLGLLLPRCFCHWY